MRPAVRPYLDQNYYGSYGPVILRSSCFDTQRRRLVAIVGYPTPTIWEYDIAGNTWVQGASMPAGYATRIGAALGYDPVRQVTVCFGGLPVSIVGQPTFGMPFQDVWHLDGSNVYQAVPGTSPASRSGGIFVWNPDADRLQLVSGSNNGADHCNDMRDVWSYLPGQQGVDYSTFGNGCAGSAGTPYLDPIPNLLPFAGRRFSVLVKRVPLFAPVFMMIGVSDQTWNGQPLPFSLDPFGAAGCSMLTGPDLVYSATNVLGTALWETTLPSTIGGSTFFQQAVVFDPLENSAGLTVSNGGRAVVGF